MTANTTMKAISLTFNDATQELEFLQALFLDKRRQIQISLLAASAFGLGYMPFDAVFIPEPLLGRVRVFRLLVMVPIPILFAWIDWKWSLGCRLFKFIAVAAIVFGSLFPLLLATVGPSLMMYSFSATLQVSLFMSFLFRVPFRYSAGVSVFLAVSLGSIGLGLDVPADQRANLVISLVGVHALIMFSAYQLERERRVAYLVAQSLDEEREESERQKAKRMEWLENFASFVGHELKNQLVGLATSIELCSRYTKANADTYIHRAKQSIQSIRTLVKSATEATTIEAALAVEDQVRVAMPELVKRRAEEYSELFACDVLVESKTEIVVKGNPDRLIQMLDKLLANAVEHSDGSQPIEVLTERRGTTAVVSIRNRGDRLPADIDSVFRLYVTTKSARDGRGHHGIGLFVAKEIAEAHGGQVLARQHIDGAEFLIELPLVG